MALDFTNLATFQQNSVAQFLFGRLALGYHTQIGGGYHAQIAILHQQAAVDAAVQPPRVAATGRRPAHVLLGCQQGARFLVTFGAMITSTNWRLMIACAVAASSSRLKA